MGYYLSEPASSKGDLTAKNRVWGFFGESVSASLETHQTALETHRENYGESRRTASGIPYWPSRDPIMELGGENLYGFVFNRPTSYIDIVGREPVPNNGMGPKADFQNPKTNCGALTAFPEAVKNGSAGGSYPPSPENMTDPETENGEDGLPGAGCREVEGAGDCKEGSPDCERHVIVYIPLIDDWGGESNPNYHTVGEISCDSGYFHQVGDKMPILGPVEDPRAAAEAYYKELQKQGDHDGRPLVETHYCCPIRGGGE